MFDALLAIAGFAIEGFGDEAFGVEGGANQREHAGELGENQGLMAFVDDFFEARDEQIELSGRFAAARGVDQAWMKGRLAETKKGFEDLDFGAVEAVAIDLL